MKKLLKIIDTLSHWTGSLSRWLCLALILVATFDVVMRYVFNAPTVWAYEVCIMVGAAMYALGWAYDHLYKSHVRVDIFYSQLSTKGKAVLDIICSLLFFFPLMFLMSKTAISWTLRAIKLNEKMAESFWYPPATPLRTVVAFGILLFLIQGVAQFIRDVYTVARGKP